MAEDHRRNSFDLLRLVAAGGVIVSHSYPLTGSPEPYIGSVTLGGVCVWTFFIISGYLVSRSWLSYPRAGIFLAKRALRIYPGLAVALLVSVLALGFVSSLSYRAYITHSDTISYADNLLLVAPRYVLPGVFTHNQYGAAVNGSLWTLPYEFAMYLAIAAFGWFLLPRRSRMLALWCAMVAANLFLEMPGNARREQVLFFLSARTAATFGLMFCSGVVLQLYPEIRRWLGPLALLGLVLFFPVSETFPRLTTVLGATAMASGVIAFGHLRHFSFLSRIGDFSYGVYIYAFPVQQLIQDRTGTLNPHRMILAALPITLVLGALSWHLVEAPALRLKDRLRLEDYPVSERRRRLVTRAAPF